MKFCVKLFYVIFVITYFFISKSATAQTGASCLGKFYKNKNHLCVTETLRSINSITDNLNGSSVIAGFLAEYFKEFPEKLNSITNENYNVFARIKILKALKICNFKFEYLNYLNKFQDSPELQNSLMNAQLLSITDSSVGYYTFEQWIGAFEQSENPQYINNIIDTGNKLNDNLISDTFRYGFLKLHNPNLTIRGKDSSYYYKLMCKRYNCTPSNQVLFKHIAGLGHAYFLIFVSANYSESIAYFSDYISKNQKIYLIYMEEFNLFKKYSNLIQFAQNPIEDKNLNLFLEAYENFEGNEYVEKIYDKLIKKQ